MKARQLSISLNSVFAIGMIDQLRFIERGADGFWGRWQVTGTNATRIAHTGDVVARIGLDGRVGAWQRAPREPWHTWDLEAVDLTAARLAKGAPALFAGDAEGCVWHTTKAAPREAWPPWEPLGGPATGLVAGLIPGGGLALFGIRNGVAVHRWQDRPGATWHGWTALDGPGGELVALDLTTIAGGGLALFALASDGTLHHSWQDAPLARWQPWQRLGSEVKVMAVTRAARGGLAVFATDRDGRLRVRVQPRPFGDWAVWHDLGGRGHQIVAQPSWTDGLEVFAIGDDDEIRHAWCERLDWPWTDWRLLEHETGPVPPPPGDAVTSWPRS
jgi:hypothetical protein